MEPVGYQAIIDFIGVEKNSLKERYLIDKLNDIFYKNNVNVEVYVNKHFGPGDTTLWVLSSSHCALHTWPEHGLLSLDIFICKDKKSSERVANEIYESFEAKEKRMEFFERPLKAGKNRRDSNC